MPERSSLNQVVQLGVEATPGTPVAATKRLQSIGIEPTVEAAVDEFRPAGQKFRALTTLGKEWSTSGISGRGSFTELIYLLSSVMTTGIITTPVGGALARKWVFSPSSTADDTPKTFTIEHGSSVRADRFSYGLVTELSMGFNRDAISVGGSMLGKAIEDNVALTGGVTLVSLIPILPTQVTLYLDDTAANLGTTKLTRAISADFSLGARFGPVWVLDAANPSFVNHIETEPNLGCNLTLQADSQGMSPLTHLRNGLRRFLRIEAIGADIDTTGVGGATATIPYRFTMDMSVEVRGTGGFSDEDGVYAFTTNFVGVHDATWGKAVEATLVNTLTAL